MTDATRAQVRRILERVRGGRLEGRAIVTLMRQTKTTIKQLSQRMGITMKRIRQVRSDGLKGRALIRDWVQGISGEDPGNL